MTGAANHRASCALARQPPGFGLVELVVALTILAVGVLGLAAAAIVAHRSFMSADASQRASVAAALVLDSLLQVAAPQAGARVVQDATVRWAVADSGAGVIGIDVAVEIQDGGRRSVIRYHALRADVATH